MSSQSPPTGVFPWGSPQAPHTLCGTDVPQNFNDLSLTFLLCIPFSGSPGSLCFFSSTNTCDRDFPGGSVVKRLPAMQETWIRFLGQEDPLEKEMAIHSSTFAWKIPWTEEPDRLQFIGSQSWTGLSDFTTSDKGLPRWLSSKESACQCGRCLSHPWMGKIPWRRKWQHTPIFLPEQIPWTEEASGLQSTGSQRYDLVTKQQQLPRQGLASPQHIHTRDHLHDLLRS